VNVRTFLLSKFFSPTIVGIRTRGRRLGDHAGNSRRKRQASGPDRFELGGWRERERFRIRQSSRLRSRKQLKSANERCQAGSLRSTLPQEPGRAIGGKAQAFFLEALAGALPRNYAAGIGTRRGQPKASNGSRYQQDSRNTPSMLAGRPQASWCRRKKRNDALARTRGSGRISGGRFAAVQRRDHSNRSGSFPRQTQGRAVTPWGLIRTAIRSPFKVIVGRHRHSPLLIPALTRMA